MEKFKILLKKDINKLPNTTGVYSFWNKKQLIYIGKAINIKSRVKNHFNQPSHKDGLFISLVNKIDFFETGSEIEALILEAKLIKKYQPKYNVLWRDDKNFFYVTIEKNEKMLPYVYITHQPKQKLSGKRPVYIGPFVEGTALKKTLKFLRRAFPYYTKKKHSKIKCTWCHLDLCPGPNPDIAEYKKNIKKLVLILQGRKASVLDSLKKGMKITAKKQDFEKAGKIRDKINALQQIMAHTRVINAPITPAPAEKEVSFKGGPTSLETYFKNFAEKKTTKILGKIIGVNKDIHRIECYDVSNIQGKQATGSMVVFSDKHEPAMSLTPDKDQYRKFKIRMKNEPNDVAMLKEILQRRFNHIDWPYPEVILIDGGKAQRNVAVSVKNIKKQTSHIKIISLAKKHKELFIEGRKKPVLLESLPQEIYNLILRLDDEAHRFAITYHRKLRQKN